jgi:hypothetical protein
MLLPTNIPERDQIVEIVKGFPRMKREVNYELTNLPFKESADPDIEDIVDGGGLELDD